MERHGVRHGNKRLECVDALLVRCAPFLVREPAEALREAPDVGVDRKDRRVQAKHQKAACDLYADARQRDEERLGLGYGHAAQGREGHAAEAFADETPRGLDIGGSPLGESDAAQRSCQFVDRCIRNLPVMRKKAFECAECRFASRGGRARAEHEIEQFIKQVSFTGDPVRAVMCEQKPIHGVGRSTGLSGSMRMAKFHA